MKGGFGEPQRTIPTRPEWRQWAVHDGDRKDGLRRSPRVRAEWEFFAKQTFGAQRYGTFLWQ
jgi:hypothetical protein